MNQGDILSREIPVFTPNSILSASSISSIIPIIPPLLIVPFQSMVISPKEASEKDKIVQDQENYPKNFDFQNKWITHCLPHLRKLEIKKAIKEGILEILAGDMGRYQTYDPQEAPAMYSYTYGFWKYLDKLEKELRDKRKIYIDGENEWEMEDDFEAYILNRKGKTCLTFKEYKKRYGNEISFQTRWDDINYYIIDGGCHSWNPSFSLALAKLVYPGEIWEVVKGDHHTTVVNKIRTICFDIVYAEIERRGKFPNPLKEALRND